MSNFYFILKIEFKNKSNTLFSQVDAIIAHKTRSSITFTSNYCNPNGMNKNFLSIKKIIYDKQIFNIFISVLFYFILLPNFKNFELMRA